MIDSFSAWKPPLYHKDTEKGKKCLQFEANGALSCVFMLSESWPRQDLIPGPQVAQSTLAWWWGGLVGGTQGRQQGQQPQYGSLQQSRLR